MHDELPLELRSTHGFDLYDYAIALCLVLAFFAVIRLAVVLIWRRPAVPQ